MRPLAALASKTRRPKVSFGDFVVTTTVTVTTTKNVAGGVGITTVLIIIAFICAMVGAAFAAWKKKQEPEYPNFLA